MSDLVERLRKHVNDRGGPAKDETGAFVGSVWPMMLEAADEIERLRHDIDRYMAIATEMTDESERLRAQLASARKDAIEECAAIAMQAGCGNAECMDCYGNQIASAIRDLIDDQRT